VSRADFLGELMAAHKGPKIAVAGTHGKTTTTAMIGVMLQHAGLDPTVFVGGEVAQLGGNVRVGSETGPFVAEACEAYDSFLSLKPDVAVITNIEADHLDHYGTFENVKESFLRFARNLQVDSGCLILCMDDPVLRDMTGGLAWGTDDKTVDVISYGIETFLSPYSMGISYGRPTQFGIAYTKDKIAVPVQNLSVGVTSEVEWGVRVALHVPGRHNVSNALAAVGVGLRLGMELEVIAEGLGEFRSVERRQEVLGEVNSILVMDDYAHHPTEIRATLDALRSAYPERRLVAVFQPHLYSRTRDFLNEFGEELAKADALIVTDIYAAREAPIANVRASDIVNLAVKKNPNMPAMFLPDKNDVPKMLLALIRPNDLVVCLGAGDIRAQGEALLPLLEDWRAAE
jgi:UDP-N-acetylmuramate--alanine ligase